MQGQYSFQSERKSFYITIPACKQTTTHVRTLKPGHTQMTRYYYITARCYHSIYMREARYARSIYCDAMLNFAHAAAQAKLSIALCAYRKTMLLQPQDVSGCLAV